jgi:hypothetical protein
VLAEKVADRRQRPGHVLEGRDGLAGVEVPLGRLDVAAGLEQVKPVTAKEGK